MRFLTTFQIADFADTLVSLFTAFVLGTLIGAERQYRQRTAGLRTNVLVAVGAAAFVDLAMHLDGADGAVRVIAYVVSGIGFLGAGVIMKHGMDVRGLNTAATLWASAAVGSCAGAGGFETVVIHPANEKPKDGGETVPYPTGHLELFGDMFAGGRDDHSPEVKTLLAFVSTQLKAVPLRGDTKSTVTKNRGPLPVDDAWVGQWTVEFANGIVETCDLVKEGTVNVAESKRSSPGKVRDTMNGVVVLAFDDDRIERWTKIGQRIVVEHWPSSDQFPGQPPVLGVGEKGKRNGE